MLHFPALADFVVFAGRWRCGAVLYPIVWLLLAAVPHNRDRCIRSSGISLGAGHSARAIRPPSDLNTMPASSWVVS